MDVAAAIAAAAETRPMDGVGMRIPVVPGRVLHADGDYLAYYFAGNDDTPEGAARRNCTEGLLRVARNVGAESIVVHLTASNSNKGGRYLAATVKPYQAQRKGSRKPRNWLYMRTFLENYQGENFRVKVWYNREADDGIAYCAYNESDPVIWTRDKDMRMLPGIHLAWDGSVDAVVQLNDYDVIGEGGKQYGYKWLLLQCLQGDTADHIPGLERVVLGGKVKQCGEATAEGMLADTKNLQRGWSIVEAAYRSYYTETWPERLAEQLALLYLRHDPGAVTHSWTLNPDLRSVASPDLIKAANELSAVVEEKTQELEAIQNAQAQSE